MRFQHDPAVLARNWTVACYRRQMEAHELAEVAARRAAAGTPYLEFITVPDLSVGLYVLAPGQPDLQQPHTEDEAYYVVAGSSRISVGDEIREVRAGSVVFVGAGVPHHFHDITSELTILVVFGPAEGSRA
jgi:mannose-6-phosphate isomerase-like protein (cupin superfamily)